MRVVRRIPHLRHFNGTFFEDYSTVTSLHRLTSCLNLSTIDTCRTILWYLRIRRNPRDLIVPTRNHGRPQILSPLPREPPPRSIPYPAEVFHPQADECQTYKPKGTFHPSSNCRPLPD